MKINFSAVQFIQEGVYARLDLQAATFIKDKKLQDTGKFINVFNTVRRGKETVRHICRVYVELETNYTLIKKTEN